MLDRPANNESEENAREKVVELCTRLLDGSAKFLEVAPMLDSLRADVGGLDQFDDDFLVFSAISSETDSLPLDAQRVLWAPHALAALEPKIEKWEIWAREQASSSCHRLISRFKLTHRSSGSLRGR